MAQPKCIKGYFRRKRYECLFGNKRGYRTRVSVLDFSRCNRAETGTPARTTFTFFLFWSVILPARHPMSVLCREVCKQSLWGVLSRLVHCTLLPNTPNAHTGPTGFSGIIHSVPSLFTANHAIISHFSLFLSSNFILLELSFSYCIPKFYPS